MANKKIKIQLLNKGLFNTLKEHFQCRWNFVFSIILNFYEICRNIQIVMNSTQCIRDFAYSQRCPYKKPANFQTTDETKAPYVNVQ